LYRISKVSRAHHLSCLVIAADALGPLLRVIKAETDTAAVRGLSSVSVGRVVGFIFAGTGDALIHRSSWKGIQRAKLTGASL